VRCSRALGACLAASLICWSCAGDAERTLLTQFFAASRLRDLTALSNYATVVFEPATDGMVTSFDVVGITVIQASDGQASVKNVLISAPVRLFDGRTVPKTIAVTMQRGLAGSDQSRSGGWMITAFKAEPASPSTLQP
jgi:hypothetical protein